MSPFLSHREGFLALFCFRKLLNKKRFSPKEDYIAAIQPNPHRYFVFWTGYRPTRFQNLKQPAFMADDLIAAYRTLVFKIHNRVVQKPQFLNNNRLKNGKKRGFR
jgi:hypothetical protein